MKREEAVYISNLIELYIDSNGGSTEQIDFTSDEVRGELSYKNGNSLESFVSETGTASSISRPGPQEISFTVRAQEDTSTRYKLERLMYLTRPNVYYKANVICRDFYHSLSAQPTGEANVTELSDWTQSTITFDCIIEYESQVIDGTLRGQGALKKEFRVILKESTTQYTFS